jgi:hypothetical protein
LQFARESDTGTYGCQAENVAGSDSKAASLIVGSVPQIMETPENIYVHLDNSITIPCRVVAIPKATINWLKNNRKIDFLAHDSGGELTLSTYGSLGIRSK